MDVRLQDKLKTLPHSPGVYFHHDKTGQIIYVGKAAVLKNRVKQYFQNQKDMDVKTKALVAEITDTDWIETESEIDALFLEAEMVKRYMPKFNILLRDDKSLIYVRIDMNNDWPFVSFTRNPADDKAEYFGPYYNGFAVKKALRYLRRIFPYYDKPMKKDYRPTKLQRSGVTTQIRPILRQGFVGQDLTNIDGSRQEVKKLDLDDHLGLTPVNMTSSQYKTNLRKLISYIKGGRKIIINDIEKDMKKAALQQNFELAASYRNRLTNLKELQQRIMFGDKEFMDISKDVALRDLTDLLKLKKIPVRIEGFDISHMSGTNVVASMVVFKNGVSERNEYRKFKTHFDKNDDYFNMNEAITRRLSEKNINNWGKPNLVLIDGGKGQLDAALMARDRLGQSDIPFIGLAKRDEQIIIEGISVDEGIIKKLGGNLEPSDGYLTVDLPNSAHIIKLLQRIRDESHRFAVSYHTTLRRTRQTSSALDEIPGIGPKTRAKLLRKFGSLKGIKLAGQSEVAKVVGPEKARRIFNNFVV